MNVGGTQSLTWDMGFTFTADLFTVNSELIFLIVCMVINHNFLQSGKAKTDSVSVWIAFTECQLHKPEVYLL